MRSRARACFLGSLSLVVMAACGDSGGEGSETLAEDEVGSTETDTETGTETGTETDTETGTDTGEASLLRTVTVTLDGEPVEGATVIQGGTGEPYFTDAAGQVVVTLDDTIPGDLALMATHPEARTIGQSVYVDPALAQDELLFELTRIAVGDNELYPYSPPGVPGDNGTTAECGHCHVRMKLDWYDSPHRQSASNPAVQDVYAGAAAALDDQASCEAAGGSWWSGLVPGSAEQAPRCYLGAGALPDLNPDCGQDAACDTVATEFGQCADCHAPAIEGPAGGRSLLEATGTAYEAGVHCDLCHKVERVEPGAAAGVAGWLHLNRPLERSDKIGLGEWEVLTFGPYVDVPNPRMGASPRTHFLTGEFCGSCHQLDQQALVPGTSLDPGRWPEGTLPVHSTYEEWKAGPFGDIAPCSSCHMPAETEYANSADLTADFFAMQGVARGWVRPPGATRRHSWVGPRTPSSGMLELAAAVFIDASVEGGVLTAELTVRNVGAGHAIPTGEPLRSMLLFVSARCGDEALAAVGGDVVPDFGGALDRQPSPADWSSWPGAEVGDVVRVLDELGWVDYEGFGPFGDGSFDAAAKGLPRYGFVGQATVVAVNGDQVSFDQPLPAGDLAVRGRPAPLSGGDATVPEAVAGAPGFGFARVLADAEGATMAPHHRAVDVRSDNRLLPQTEWTSTHLFESACAEPVVEATLVHRAYPVAIATERGWDNPQQVMVEVSL